MGVLLARMCMYVHYIYAAPTEARPSSGSGITLELELQTEVRGHVEHGNPTWVSGRAFRVLHCGVISPALQMDFLPFFL